MIDIVAVSVGFFLLVLGLVVVVGLLLLLVPEILKFGKIRSEIANVVVVFDPETYLESLGCF